MPTASSRFHGRNARLYVGLASAAAAASPVLYLNKWDMQNATDKDEVTAWGDNNKAYVVGLPDDKGSFAGSTDIGGADFYTAARDGAARKFYMYPDTVNTPGAYWFGTAFFDQNIEIAVNAGGKTSGNWVAASDILRVIP